MTRHHLSPVRLLLLLAFVLAGALPQARGHDISTPAALVLQDQSQGILSGPRHVLQALVPDDDAADPHLPQGVTLPHPPVVKGRAILLRAVAAPVTFASIPPARGPPAV